MSKSYVVRIKCWIWDILEAKSKEHFGRKGAEQEYLAMILTTNATKSVAVPVKNKKKKLYWCINSFKFIWITRPSEINENVEWVTTILPNLFDPNVMPQSLKEEIDEAREAVKRCLVPMDEEETEELKEDALAVYTAKTDCLELRKREFEKDAELPSLPPRTCELCASRKDHYCSIKQRAVIAEREEWDDKNEGK